MPYGSELTGAEGLSGIKGISGGVWIFCPAWKSTFTFCNKDSWFCNLASAWSAMVRTSNVRLMTFCFNEQVF
jgi:hypothetical protein